MCCLHKLPPFVPKEVAELYLVEMCKPKLIFRTTENEERYLAALEELHEDTGTQTD